MLNTLTATINNPQIDQVELSKQLTAHIDDVLRDGYALRDVLVVLRENYFYPRDLHIVSQFHGGGYFVFHQRAADGTGKGKIFEHSTLAACVEFALKYTED